MVKVSQISQLANTLSTLKAYESVEPETGAVVNNIKYLIGNPRQYRFNGQNGRFNINGTKDLGNMLEFSPMAWRIFNADLFGRKNRDIWAELFFIDVDSCVCSVMFNNTSAQILQTLLSQLVYDGLAFEDILLKVTSEKRTNEKVNGTYYIAQFSYTPLQIDSLTVQRDFASDFLIYRQDTVSVEEEIILCSESYRSPKVLAWRKELQNQINQSA